MNAGTGLPLAVDLDDTLTPTDTLVEPGGLLFYKDMANRPVSFALANRLHDLIMAYQWIHYAPIAQVRSWGFEAGLCIEQESQYRMLWYAHEWIVFKKPPTPT